MKNPPEPSLDATIIQIALLRGPVTRFERFLQWADDLLPVWCALAIAIGAGLAVLHKAAP